MILPRQLAQLLMAPVVKQNKEFFVDKMAAAMEYNLVKKGKLSERNWKLGYSICLLHINHRNLDDLYLLIH